MRHEPVRPSARAQREDSLSRTVLGASAGVEGETERIEERLAVIRLTGHAHAAGCGLGRVDPEVDIRHECAEIQLDLIALPVEVLKGNNAPVTATARRIRGDG